MNNLEWFKKEFEHYDDDLREISDWQHLRFAAIYLKSTGQLSRATAALEKAIELTRTQSHLTEQTATMVNFLSDLYLLLGATEKAEHAIRDAIDMSGPFPLVLAANWWILARVLKHKGKYQEARVAAQEALRLYTEQQHTHGIAQSLEILTQLEAQAQGGIQRTEVG